jgi:hypothetical protein
MRACWVAFRTAKDVVNGELICTAVESISNMGKTKPFIQKNSEKVHHFRLVHRSQHDPLIASQEASERVLSKFTPANHPEAAASAASFENDHEDDMSSQRGSSVSEAKRAPSA